MKEFIYNQRESVIEDQADCKNCTGKAQLHTDVTPSSSQEQRI